MSAVDLVLWIIFAAIIALLPCGCYFTWPKKDRPKATNK